MVIFVKKVKKRYGFSPKFCNFTPESRCHEQSVLTDEFRYRPQRD